MIALRIAIVLLVFSALLNGCAERWTGFVYPDENDLSTHIVIGDFSSFETCRDAAEAAMSNLDGDTRPTFECGLDCEPMGTSGMNLCQETRD